LNTRQAHDPHGAGRNAEAAFEVLHAEVQAGLSPASFDIDAA
jgi:hypothetical protein